MDTNDNSQSRFPRASLRARNKTILASPSDVADYNQGVSEGEAQKSRIEQVLEASLEGVTHSEPSSVSVLDAALGDDFADLMVLSKGVADSGASGGDVKKVGSKEVDILEDDFNGSDSVGANSSVLEKIDEQSSFNSAAPEFVLDDLLTDDGSLDEDVQEDLPDGLPDDLPGESLQTVPVARIVRVGDGRKVDSQTSDYRDIASEGANDMQQQEPSSAREQAYWKKPGNIVGFLVSFSSQPFGAYVELREGRLLVTSEIGLSNSRSSENNLIIRDESVSPMHAILRMAGDGTILILDQLSEHGTRIRHFDSGTEETLMGDKSSLKHGDVVIFGECEYHVCLLAKDTSSNNRGAA